ncbi:homoserine O-acetyltransferase/O-succinyltransferase family protein [Rhizobium leguminosarum]|uniref:homoserine O-acetyltransferase/O-succinyltransferase family protein n=1 Tax=Rhizobium leguminosarum TaxID=384 RepID=UPI003F4FA15C
MEMERSGFYEIGLVNNMPDAALAGTELQFRCLLEAAAWPRKIRLKFYFLDSLPRSPEAKQYLMRSGYSDQSYLRSGRLDGLIVTGTQPSEQDLRLEPYWSDLVSVFDWADSQGCPTILSCLAAHAALLYFDGLSRDCQSPKCFGVFKHKVLSKHPLTAGLPRIISVPHSRQNSVRESSVKSLGYQVLIRGYQGFHCVCKRRGAEFVYLQGHPEYDGTTLLKEYRRDVLRYLAGSIETYPEIPVDYFDTIAVETLRSFSELAQNNRKPEVGRQFPYLEISAAKTKSWQEPAKTFFRNWLLQLNGTPHDFRPGEAGTSRA